MSEYGCHVKHGSGERNRTRDRREYAALCAFLDALLLYRSESRLTEIERRADVVRAEREHDHFGEHVRCIIYKGIDHGIGGGNGDISPYGEAGDNVAGVAQDGNENGAAEKSGALLLYVSEDSRKSAYGKRDDVVEEDHRNDGRGTGDVGERSRAEQELYRTVDETAEVFREIRERALPASP